MNLHGLSGPVPKLWQTTLLKRACGLLAFLVFATWHTAFTGTSLQPPGVRQQELAVPRHGFAWHARDPKGVKHIETRNQARVASYLRQTLEEIFNACEVSLERMGDEDMQYRLQVHDVIMSRGCRAAYVHVAASGDKLEQRQAFVWLARNKGKLKTALAKRWKRRKAIPQIYFLESKFDDWDQQFRRARKYPELNEPDPYSSFPSFVPEWMEKAPVFRKLRRDDSVERFQDTIGMGDETKPYPKWGYPQ
ncbi:MCA1 [Symbiodinium microadriaticum]|nr:MCA1 [Symbiodinium sp. KB8]CAE7222288.1 MCA1 [Symbiodinium microadriaticum]